MFGISTIAATVGKVAVTVATNMVVAAFGEKALAHVFFSVAEKVAASTENAIDDKWVADTKEAYYGND